MYPSNVMTRPLEYRVTFGGNDLFHKDVHSVNFQQNELYWALNVGDVITLTLYKRYRIVLFRSFFPPLRKISIYTKVPNM